MTLIDSQQTSIDKSIEFMGESGTKSGVLVYSNM